MRKLLIVLALCGVSILNAQQLNVASYNVRNSNPNDAKAGNGWEQRCPVLTQLITFHDFDIFGAQEVKHNQLEDMLNALPAYNYIGVGRDDGKTKGEYAPIFYRKDKFKLLKSGNFWLSEDTTKPNKGWDAALGAGIGATAGVAGKMKLEKINSIKKLKNATNARINKVHDYRTEKVETEMQRRINASVDPFEKSVIDEVRRGKHDIINNSRKNMIETVGKKKRKLKIATAAIPIAGAIIGAVYGRDNNLKKQRDKIEDAAGDRVAEVIRGIGKKGK
jgi:hypothetical protein